MSGDCAAAHGAAAAATVGSHGLGDRKELSGSHKQESSCARYSQDLEKTLLGHSVRPPLQRLPAVDLPSTDRCMCAPLFTRDCHLRVTRLS